MDTKSILEKSFNRAIGGGLSGTSAMIIQVSSLMWLRTTVNYQYRYGKSTTEAFKYLYSNGGVRRFYRGYSAALLQAPLSRFGDTAANTGVMYYLNNNEDSKDLPIAVKTFIGSSIAGIWRINLMPIDTCKTIMQVEGKNGISILRNKIKSNGVKVLYHGSYATCLSTMIGHFPWFLTYNYLNETLPNYDDSIKKFSRSAVIGFSSSFVSDISSNFMRVIKVSKQSNQNKVTYKEVVKTIIDKEGYMGLFGRGLKTKIISNGIQGICFTVLWKYFQEKFQS